MANRPLKRYAELRHHWLVGEPNAQRESMPNRVGDGMRLACKHHWMPREGRDDCSAQFNIRYTQADSGEYSECVKASGWMFRKGIAGKAIGGSTPRILNDCFNRSPLDKACPVYPDSHAEFAQ